MVTANLGLADDAVEHIGLASHTIRNLFIGGSLFASAAILAVFYWPGGDREDAAAAELSQFRQAMFNRCGGEQFSGNTDPQLAAIYADSSRMRAVVVKQFHQLQRPNTDCVDVAKALRSADYPIR